MFLVYLASFIYILSGGFSWFFIKMHSGSNVPVEFSVFYRQFIAAIFFLLISILCRKDLRLNKKKAKLILTVSFLYYTCYMLGAYYGSLFLIAGLVSAISSTRMLFVEIFLSIFYKKRPSTRILISAIIGTIGISLLSKSNMNFSHINLETLLIGVLISFVAPISNAASNFILEVKKVKKEIDSTVMISYCSFLGSIFVLIIGLLRNNFHFILPPLETKYMIGLAYLSLISSGVATLCTYYLVSKIGSLKATYMSITHPPLSLILTVLLAHGKFDVYNVSGMIFCIYSLYNGIRYQSRKAIYEKITNERKKRDLEADLKKQEQSSS